MELVVLDQAVGKASYHHAADQQLVTLARSGLRGVDLLVWDMLSCHLERFHPLEPVGNSLGLDHPGEDIDCEGALVRRSS